MARRLSTKLLRLIRERSYLAGEVTRLEQVVAERLADLEQAQARVAAAKAQLAEMDTTITTLEPTLRPDDIRSQRRIPRRYPTAHGRIVDTLVEVLQEAGPQGITSRELTRQLLLVFPMDVSSSDLYEDARHRFRRPLLTLKKRGVVEQIGEEKTPGGKTVVRWRWIGG